jgi:hypothetical protein
MQPCWRSFMGAMMGLTPAGLVVLDMAYHILIQKCAVARVLAIK